MVDFLYYFCLIVYMKIAIIGGGITGAYLQFKLSIDGYDSVIFEKEDSTGGLLRPFNILGINITLGPHRYFIDWLKLNNINPYVPLKFKEGFIILFVCCCLSTSTG